MSRRASTIGANPLDAVVPLRTADKKQAQPVAREAKERATFQLPADLIERTRRVVFWTPGATMAAIMEEALSAHLDRIEKQRGEAFPDRRGALRTGRPMKT